MSSSAARRQTIISSIPGSSGDSAALKRAEIRQRIARFRERNSDCTFLIAPGHLHLVLCVEAGDVNLAAQPDWKFIGLADDLHDRAGGQRLAIVQHQAEKCASG